MQRLRDLRRWLHDHPVAVDAFWAVVVQLLALPTFAVLGSFHVGWPWVLLWAMGLMVLPLVWRRTRPDLAMAAVVLGCAIQLVITDELMPADIAAPMMLYAVAAYGSRRLRWWWLGLAVVGGLLGGLDWSSTLSPENGPRPANAIAMWVFVAAISIASFVPGVLARQRKDMLQSLRDRADSLERERDSMARLAAQEERARIAREMHDVVAHSLSVIVVQSDGAAYAVEHGDPQQAKQLAARTLATIGDTARGALAETRRLVGVLRDADADAEYTPQATLDQLDELVAHVREAGMPASLTVAGDPQAHQALDSPQQMAVYRVVQEALTNAMKHAGPGARVDVEVRHLPDRVELAVRDTGGGSTGGDGKGNGLIGMRERMTSLGGDFVARERMGGGFEVLASLPTDPARPGTRDDMADATTEGDR